MNQNIKKQLKVALVHDFLREYGGAERVVEALHEMFPDAPLYVAFLDKKALGIHWQNFESWDIRQTWFSKIPLHKKLYSPLRFLAPRAFADLDLSDYDLVISSSNAFEAKAVLSANHVDYNDKDATTKQRQPIHICYCHTPPRALYGYSTMSSWKKNPLIHFFGTLINHYMRVVDFNVAQKVDYFIANSQETARRIKKFYRRDSTVIYPPVNMDFVKQDDLSTSWRSRRSLSRQARGRSTNYYLYVNRLGLQKHPELAVQACNKLKLPLKVVGTGQMEEKLKVMAGKTIEFLGAVDDATLHNLYAGAKALIYPVEDEDFGIVPVEAMGHGVPVIAHRSGGPMETVAEGKTGLFFEELSVEAVVGTIKKFEKSMESIRSQASGDELRSKKSRPGAKKLKANKIREHASKFRKREFTKKMVDFINQLIKIDRKKVIYDKKN